MKFKRDYLTAELDLPREPGSTYNGCTVLSDHITDNGRWTIYHEMIFCFDNQLLGEAWRVSYGVGATESQDESPWEYKTEVEAVLVRQVEKVVKVWEDYPEGEGQ